MKIKVYVTSCTPLDPSRGIEHCLVVVYGRKEVAASVAKVYFGATFHSHKLYERNQEPGGLFIDEKELDISNSALLAMAAK